MITKWYNGLFIPTFDYPSKINGFVASSLGIAQGIVQRNISSEYTVNLTTDLKVPIAAVDMINKIIYINSNLFNRDPKLRHNPNAGSQQTISMLMGLVTHEACHIEYTVSNIKEAFSFCDFELNELNKTVFNIVEDYFIDGKALTVHRAMDWALQSALDYFFPIKEIVESLNDLPLKIETMEDVGKYIKAICNCKNELRFNSSKVKTTPLFNALYILVTRVHKIEDNLERINHAKKIVQFLLKDVSEKEQEKVKSKSEGGEGELDDLLEELSKVLSNILDKEELGIVSSSEVEKVLNLSTVFSKGEEKQSIVSQVYVSKNNLTVFGFTPENGLQAHIGFDDRFLPLSQLIRARSQANQPKGEQKNSGRSITQIHRIVTDSKIFAQPIIVPFVGPQEVIILVDCSGSMAKNYKIKKALSAAYGAAMGLQNGGHKVCVVGHTAELGITKGFTELTNSLMVYTFKNFKDSVVTLSKNIDIFVSFFDTKANNNDDLAILHCVNLFTKERNKKNLIVISDGMPASHRINIEGLGKEWARDAVNLLRTKNISVFSISIDKAAFEPNNFIYGEQYNLNSEDAVNITKIVEGMFKI